MMILDRSMTTRCLMKRSCPTPVYGSNWTADDARRAGRKFHPCTDMSRAMAETVMYVNRSRAFMPTGTVPPFVMRFDAGSVPVGDLVFSDETGKLGLKDLQDAALFKVRPLFATLPGVSAPPPFGGSPRTVVISADPDRLRAYNMSPDEIVQAISKGHTISPSGNVRIANEIPI